MFLHLSVKINEDLQDLKLLRMDLCDYDLSLPPDHPYNVAAELSASVLECTEDL